MKIVFAPSLQSGLMGAYGMFFMAVIAILFATRRISKRTPLQLMTGVGAAQEAHLVQNRSLLKHKAFSGMVLTGILAIGSLLGAKSQAGAMAQTLSFFSGGMLTLIAGLCAASLVLGSSHRWLAHRHDLTSLGIRNSARKRGRSLSVIIIMAAGVFMVCATNAFRQESTKDAAVRTSGTGGFRFIGESSLPIYEDLNTTKAREKYGLDDDELEFSVVPFRLREGEEASCLNLNQAQRPRLLAVNPTSLSNMGAFTFQQGSSWDILSQPLDDGAIPGLMDMNSATYALKVKVGDDILYQNEAGEPLRIRLVGLLQNSILQGSVIISVRGTITARVSVSPSSRTERNISRSSSSMATANPSCSWK